MENKTPDQNIDQGIWDIDADSQAKKAQTYLQIKIIAFAFLLYYVIRIIASFGYYWLLFSKIDSQQLLPILMSVAPIAYILTGVLFLLKKDKTGWILLMLYAFSYSLAVAIATISMFALSAFQIAAREILFPRWILDSAVTMIFFISAFYHLSKPDIRSFYGVKRSQYKNLIILGVFGAIAYIAFNVLNAIPS